MYTVYMYTGITTPGYLLCKVQIFSDYRDLGSMFNIYAIRVPCYH